VRNHCSFRSGSDRLDMSPALHAGLRGGSDDGGIGLGWPTYPPLEGLYHDQPMSTLGRRYDSVPQPNTVSQRDQSKSGVGIFVGTMRIARHVHAGQQMADSVELSTVDRAGHAWSAVAYCISVNSGSAYRGSNPCVPVSTFIENRFNVSPLQLTAGPNS